MFPHDIIEQIISSIESRKDIVNLSLVCKTWKTFLEPKILTEFAGEVLHESHLFEISKRPFEDTTYYIRRKNNEYTLFSQNHKKIISMKKSWLVTKCSHDKVPNMYSDIFNLCFSTLKKTRQNKIADCNHLSIKYTIYNRKRLRSLCGSCNSMSFENITPNWNENSAVWSLSFKFGSENQNDVNIIPSCKNMIIKTNDTNQRLLKFVKFKEHDLYLLKFDHSRINIVNAFMICTTQLSSKLVFW